MALLHWELVSSEPKEDVRQHRLWGYQIWWRIEPGAAIKKLSALDYMITKSPISRQLESLQTSEICPLQISDILPEKV